ncbi:hypothetical protein Bca4012_016113 [Brassica carinata]
MTCRLYPSPLTKTEKDSGSELAPVNRSLKPCQRRLLVPFLPPYLLLLFLIDY